MDERVIYTVGHSNTGMNKFIGTLNQNNIKTIIDVRSAPYSRYAPQFNKDNIKRELEKEGITYIFMGNVLGGKPEQFNDKVPDDAKYREIKAQEGYRNGILRLIEIANTNKTAIMCSEENPGNCHRHLLITQSLIAKGAKVKHIRCDGTIEDAKKQAQTKLLF
jgi:uncharacterized protein (DUF488 family)